MPRATAALAATGLCLWLAGHAWGASIAEQRRELSRAATALRVAERMAGAGRTTEATAAFTEAQEALSRVASGLDDRLQRSFDRVRQNVAETHAKLTAAGIELPPLAESNPTATSPAPTLRSGGAAATTDAVSFVDQVVPILTAHCGKCHVDGKKGGASFATYNDIVEGAPAGRFVEVGSGMESLLVDVIASGQMPPDGNAVSPADAQLLLMWINQGAKFDGDDPNKPLGRLVKSTATLPGPNETPAPQPEAPPVRMATGDETVHFATAIAPLLVESCAECHGTAGPRAGFSVATFDRLWAGGNSGPAIVPGDPQASLLVQKLRGTAKEGAQMPQNRPAWSTDQIALVETWIAEGATFDGPSTTESLGRVAAVMKLERATPEEVSAEREQTAQRHWRLAIPDESAASAASEHFLAVGNLPEQALERLVAAAETQASAVQEFFDAKDQPFSKGRVTLYAFAKRIDYSEFGTMVERRGLPSDATGHTQFDVANPYVALVFDDRAADSVDRQLATSLATLWVADRSQGRLPDWFSTGVGRAVAAKLHPRDEAVRGWREQLPAAVRTLSEPDAFMTGKLPPQISELLSFGFVDAVLQKQANFNRLLNATAEGSSFEAACQQVFERSPKELAELWVASQRRRR